MQILVGGHVLGLFSGGMPDFGGHLFLAYSFDDTIDNSDIIIRGGPVGNNWLSNPLSPIEMQINVRFDLSYENPEQWASDPNNTDGLFETPVSISHLDGLNSSFSIEAAWQSLSYLAEQIGLAGLDYDLLNQNSNSVVGTLLSVIGFGPQEAGFAVPGGNPYYYPAVNYTLTGDWLLDGNISYRIRGGYAADYQGTELPYADRLFALNANTPFGQNPNNLFAQWQTGDHLSTFGGNDELHDGNRKDTLEGGTGDDTYILQDDGAADIIITGEGDDIARGGGAEDRLVLRIDILDKMYEDWRAQLEYSNLTFGTTYVLTGDALLKPSERMGEEASTSGLPILGGFWEMACDGVECVRLNTGTFYPTLSNPEEAGPGSLAATFPHLVYAYNWNDGDGIAQQAQVFPFGYRFELVDGDLVITFAYGTPPEGQKGVDIAQHTVTVKDFQDGDFGIHIYDPTLIIVPGSPVYEFDMHLEEWVVANSGPDSAYASVTDAEHVAYINNGGHYIPILAAIDPATTGSFPQSPPQPAPGIDGDENDNLITGGAPDELIRGHAGNDTINANGGDDRVDGGDGDDIIHLGNGADLAIGGSGLDVLFGEGGADGISGGAGDDQISGGAGKDWLFGDAGNDVIAGDSGNDTLEGGDGDDSLDGGAGLDRLYGGAGQDTLTGGKNADTLSGGDGIDALWGGDGKDVLNGDAGNDLLHGEGADDTVNGGDGEDTLWGGNGNDLLLGDSGNDAIWGGSGNDRLEGGVGDDMLNGEGSDDILIGGDGNDVLSGSNGRDVLDGGEGDDNLTGGAAEDRFVFASGYGHDRITDFAGNDYIVLDLTLATDFADAMSHAGQAGADVAFTFGDDILILANRSLGSFNAGDFEFA